MDKATGKELMLDGKPVTSESSFTPKKSSGTVDVTFTFNASTLAGHDVVVFEKLLLASTDTGLEITSHEDLEDKGQTITIIEVPKETPPAKTPGVSPPVKTGDNSNILLYIGIAAAALIAAGTTGIVYYRKQKRNQEK